MKTKRKTKIGLLKRNEKKDVLVTLRSNCVMFEK